MYSSEEPERFYVDYQNEWVPRGMILRAYCDGNNVPYKVMENFMDAIGKKIVTVEVCFMDGINGITAGYSLAVIVPLMIMDAREPFIEPSFLVVVMLSLLVFSVFNFRPRGRAKCFAGDVGSVGMAFIVLFAIGMLIARTGDVTWLVLLLVYGVDGCLTICHRIMLHENLGQAHRKHAYQLMANELGMSHPLVSAIYMVLQLLVSLGFIFLIPDTVSAHWLYLSGAVVVLCVVYVVFMKRYYHLHAEYLASLKNGD